MGIFRQKQALPRSETAMLAAADLGPIHLNLDNYRLTFEDCSWTPEYDAPEMPEGVGSVEEEICKLRREKRRMWTMRALDEKEECEGSYRRRPHSTGGMSLSREGSPKRCSPKRSSPKRSGRYEITPPSRRNRHPCCNDDPSPSKRSERCH
uniref:Uncharacterized protein n=1 Tax=Physcomitrium patens TaxID=3218 RepID=A0A7I4BMP3_PHYPA